jgi:1,4-alpha-glucan branching enzyme
MALTDLREQGIPFHLTIGLTPVLVEQLRDPLVNEHFVEYVSKRLAAAETDVPRFRAAGELQLAANAEFYQGFYGDVLAAYRDRFGSDIVGGFKSLQDSGHIEIATSGATHGYLPLMSRDSTIAAQVGVGVQSYERVFGRRPKAIWLPECAYRPGYYAEDQDGTHERPGIERFLAEQGLQVFFSETHTVEGGRPVGKAAGDAVGPYGEIARRYVAPLPTYREPTLRTTFEPYWVSGVDVAVIARNNRTGLQVWSGEHGYPGDFRYREFHRKDGTSGLNYWRISGRGVDIGQKSPWEPDRASEAVAEHARHFAELVEEMVTTYHSTTGRYGIVSSAYDTELFGHWWFEGIDWIRQVLTRLAQSEVVDLTTASLFVQQHPPEEVLELPESSWGQGGGHFTWLNVDTEWMWPIIHAHERRMEALVAQHEGASGATLEVLRQAAREALLLQSSDWPFLVSTGQAGEYAITRFQQHVHRFEQLADALSTGPIETHARELAANLYERDRLFADVDYRLFRSREEGQAALPTWRSQIA